MSAKSQPKTRIRPVHVIIPEGHGTARILRGVGFRAVCDCAHRGPTRPSYMEARKDLRAHRLWHAQATPLSLAGPL